MKFASEELDTKPKFRSYYYHSTEIHNIYNVVCLNMILDRYFNYVLVFFFSRLPSPVESMPSI